MDARVEAPPTPREDPTTPADADVQVSPDGKTVRVEAAPPAPEQKTEERPTWLPEKFKAPDDLKTAAQELAKKQGASDREVRLLAKLSGEELATEYAELEKAQSKPPKADDKKDPLQIDPDAATPDQAQDLLSKAGLNMDEFSEEYAEKGELSEATYEKLTKAGFPRTLVDQFVAGQIAQAKLADAEVFAKIGGEEKYGEMAEWVKANVPKPEIEAFNKAVSSRDQAARLTAVQGMFARFAEAEGKEPRLIGGDGGSGGDEGFTSQQEMIDAVNHPRYKAGDKAYHAMIDRKLMRSKIF